MKIRRALLSVSDKTGIVELARALSGAGVEILSTGGTAAVLRQAGILLQEVSDYTGFPEIMDGRVKTLHPKIHGGLLGRLGKDESIMEAQQIPAIDLLVVNLYPFAQTVSLPEGGYRLDCDLETAIEQIDIGGPTMLRAAAKNFARVLTVVDPADYTAVIAAMTAHEGETTLETRFEHAKKVFAYTAQYDAAISNYLYSRESAGEHTAFPDILTMQWRKQQGLRYGENPHQRAALYVDTQSTPFPSVASARLLQGKELSYNNIADANAALLCIKAFAENPTCVIVKHANPCGVAVADEQFIAYKRAFQTDTTSAFGGIIAFNSTLLGNTAKIILNNQFVEVIIAPAATEEAIQVLAQKPNVRLLTTGFWESADSGLNFLSIEGGMLIQDPDIEKLNLKNLTVVSKRKPEAQELLDLAFAWRVAQYVKSNAIVYAKNQATIGIGAGQMSRVFSALLAGMKAEAADLSVTGAVMASDAFFPFRDGIDAAAKVGIRAIIQPGGSIRDPEVIEAADEADIAMVFTGVRHFKH